MLSAATQGNFSSDSYYSQSQRSLLTSAPPPQRQQQQQQHKRSTPLSTPTRKRANLAPDSRNWRNWLQNEDVERGEEAGVTTEASSNTHQDADRTRDTEDDAKEQQRKATETATAAATAEEEADDERTVDDHDASDDEEPELFSFVPPPALLDEPVLPIAALPTRSAVTPVHSQVEDSDTVPLGADSDATAPLEPPTPTRKRAARKQRRAVVDDDRVEIAPLPVLSPSISPRRQRFEAKDSDSHDSASLSPTRDYFMGKREEREALGAVDAYASTAQWQPQWQPATTLALPTETEDEMTVPFRDTTSGTDHDIQDMPLANRLTAEDAPDDLTPAEREAWRRYHASVQPLAKRHDVAPNCDCGAESVMRIVKKNSRNYGREFWACARSKQRCKFFAWADDGRAWDDMSSGARREAYFENMKKTLACQTVLRPQYKAENVNKHLTDILERMRTQYKAAGDQFRVLGYTKAINAIKRCRRTIASGDEARQLYGVGDRIATKIDEIIRTGQLRQVNHAVDCEEGRCMELFSKVWGAGPATARKWFAAGFRTLDDLKAHEEQLTRSQRIGLKHYHDFLERIPRAEVARIESIVAQVCVRYDPGFFVIACGSFRRGKSDCGDIDILVTHPDGRSHASILRPMLRKLSDAGYLTDTLTISEASKEREEKKKLTGNGEVGGTQSSYHGVFRLTEPDSKHRRLDIICVPYNEMGCALLYFTGSDYFNRSMRHYAKQLNYSLSQHGISPAVRTDNGKTKNHVGMPIPTPTELDVFNVLGLEYVEPENRDPSK